MLDENHLNSFKHFHSNFARLAEFYFRPALTNLRNGVTPIGWLIAFSGNLSAIKLTRTSLSWPKEYLFEFSVSFCSLESHFSIKDYKIYNVSQFEFYFVLVLYANNCLFSK